MKLKKSMINIRAAESRLYRCSVPIIALTGGIATGKSTVSRILKAHGHPLVDADVLVKTIYQSDKAIEYIASLGPYLAGNGQIDFNLLRKEFFSDSVLKQNVETFIYSRLESEFYNAFKALKSPSYIIYDVPLLFEKSIEELVDIKVLVYANPAVQKSRLMLRDSISEELAQKILDQQMSIEDKKSKADFIIDNEGTEHLLEEKVLELERLIFE